jgi:hypothetical protein
MHALSLFDLDSSASGDESASPEPPRKHPKKSFLPKGILKPSVMKGSFGKCAAEFFHFDTVEMVVARSDAIAKGLGGDDVRTTAPLIAKPPADVEAALGREAGMLHIALVSRRRWTISHDAVCGLLNECLQDVSFPILASSYFVGCYWASMISHL